MHAIRPHQPGGPEVMQLAEHPTPTPGPREALIRVAAAGVNYIDIYHRSGQYPLPSPMPLGLEGAGIVEAVGSPDLGVSPGDRVAWAAGPGSYATQAVVAADRLVPVPEGVALDVAAASML